MSINRALFTRTTDEWRTPLALYDALNAEFQFVDDPCPLGGTEDGLAREWKSPCYVNPPYSNILAWMKKAASEAAMGKTIVLLVPSRTCTAWWHDYALNASEIRFIRKRLRFGDSKINAPFPSCLVIFRGAA